jgi:hypothetical protein
MHGGMQAAQNFMALGEALADAFARFIPGRRANPRVIVYQNILQPTAGAGGCAGGLP